MNPSPAIRRRTFLQTTAAALALPPICESAADERSAKLADGLIQITMWDPVEVLICGSTLFACQLAVDSARAGLRTALMMERVNPFLEGVSCLRPWVEAAQIAALPEILLNVTRNPATSEAAGERTYFNASTAALEIEDQLCDAGVQFFYNSPAAGALGSGDQLAGVVFGGKTGLFAREAMVIVDATADATIARAVGADFRPVAGPRRYHWTVDLVKPVLLPRQTRYQAANGTQVTVQIHHYFAEFDFVLDSRSSGPFALAEDYELIYAAALECPWAETEKRFRGADAFLSSGGDRLAANSPRVPGFDNLLVFGPQGIPGNQEGSLALRNPLRLFSAFPHPLAQLRDARRPLRSHDPKHSRFAFLNRGVPEAPPARKSLAHRFHDHGFAEPGTTTEFIQFAPPASSRSASVLVVGGGTSGNAATFAAASLGLDTLCLERGPELGGTNTIGGVNKLWFGNRTRAFEDYYAAMDARNDGRNAPGFFRGVSKSGAHVLFHSTITGVALADCTVQAIYVITPAGLAAVEAPRMVDASGDGSIAAWAGCGYTFGGGHDELTLWASFAGYRPGNAEALRPFLSPLDERSPLDLTRFILAMRRNSKISLESKHVPPPFYVAPRESRHIRGGKTVTFLDVLAGRRFKDGVFRALSNPDIKGVATSDAAKSGFIPVDWRFVLQVTVPYSAMLPEGLDNVILAGKAYSATHDAFATARMQRDLCVMGLVAGHAVRLAVDRKVLLRDIPVPELQATLIAKGMLQPEDLAGDDFGFGLSPEELVAKLTTASSLDECLAVSAQLCLLPPEQTSGLLEPLAAQPENRALLRVAAFLGRRPALDRYLALVQSALDQPQLSNELFGGKATGHRMPDQGYAPDAALWLGSLAHARDRSATPLLAKLAGRVSDNPEEIRSTWGYFFSLACGFERLAGPEGCEPLRQLLSKEIFANRGVPRNADLRRCADIAAERLTYLRLALSRALTRCGDPQGAHTLCEFLNEARLCYARAAHAELVAATGVDLGFRDSDWLAWLDQRGSQLRPNPLTTPFG